MGQDFQDPAPLHCLLDHPLSSAVPRHSLYPLFPVPFTHLLCIFYTPPVHLLNTSCIPSNFSLFLFYISPCTLPCLIHIISDFFIYAVTGVCHFWDFLCQQCVRYNTIPIFHLFLSPSPTVTIHFLRFLPPLSAFICLYLQPPPSFLARGYFSTSLPLHTLHNTTFPTA